MLPRSLRAQLLAMVLACAFGVIGAVTPACAQFDTAHYSMYRVGQRLPSTITLGDGPHVVCFASESSCFICMENLEEMQRTLASRACISMSLVLATSDVGLGARLRATYEWQFPVIADPYGAMHTGFGVHHGPYFYVTDRTQTIVAMGPIGSSENDWAEFKRVIDTLCVSNHTQAMPLKLVREIPVSCNREIKSVTLQRQMQTFDRGRSHVISLPALNVLVLVSNDSCRMAGTSQELLTCRMSMPMVIPSSVLDTTAYVVDVPTEEGTVVLARIGRVHRSSHSDTIRPQREGLRAWLFSAASRDARYVATTLKQEQSDSEVEASNPTVALRSAPLYYHDRIDYIGRCDSIFSRFRLDGYYWQCVAFENDTSLVFLQNLSDTLYRYNLISQKTTTNPISFDTTTWLTGWRRYARMKSDTTTLEHQKSLGAHSSTLHGVYVDEQRGGVYVAYLNVDHYGAHPEFMLHGPVGSATCTTRAMPGQAMPHAVYDGIVYATNVVNGQLTIQMYELPGR